MCVCVCVLVDGCMYVFKFVSVRICVCLLVDVCVSVCEWVLHMYAYLCASLVCV